MALTITDIQPTNAGCAQHKTVTVNHEGTTRTFVTSLAEIDDLIVSLGGPIPAQKALVMLWAAYRRAQGRTTTGVVIA